jgi:hypothetical protein
MLIYSESAWWITPVTGVFIKKAIGQLDLFPRKFSLAYSLESTHLNKSSYLCVNIITCTKHY